MTEKPLLYTKPDAAITWDVREDFELACIREFSHSDLHLGIGVSRGERRERIRAAILRENKAHLRWRNSGFTYANMYTQAYRQPLGASGTHDEDSEPRESRGRGPAIDDDFADDEKAFEGDNGISA
jgi:hypothetical protein